MKRVTLNTLLLNLQQEAHFYSYIANPLLYKIRNDLKIYKRFELESTFIEIINPRKSGTIALLYHPPPLLLMMTHHEKTRLKALP